MFSPHPQQCAPINSNSSKVDAIGLEWMPKILTNSIPFPHFLKGSSGAVNHFLWNKTHFINRIKLSFNHFQKLQIGITNSSHFLARVKWKKLNLDCFFSEPGPSKCCGILQRPWVPRPYTNLNGKRRHTVYLNWCSAHFRINHAMFSRLYFTVHSSLHLITKWPYVVMTTELSNFRRQFWMVIIASALVSPCCFQQFMNNSWWWWNN